MIIILVIAIYITSFFADISILGYSDTSDWYTRITYMFAHKSILHLAINAYAYYMFKKAFGYINIRYYIIIAYLSAFLATYGTEMQLPTIGLSGVIYAMWGIYWFKRMNKESTIIVAFTMMCNILIYFIGYINTPLHILSFIYSIIISYCYERIRKHVFERRNKSSDGTI